MLWHPLVVGLTALDLTILTLLLKAGSISLKVILKWTPESSDTNQLQLERRFETADIMAQWAFVLMAAATIIIVAAITLVLPQIVPGAMCGMGVMQTLDDQGYQLVIVRGLVFCLLYWQRVLARLNHNDPMSPLTILLARLQLMVSVFEVMTVYDSLTTFFLYMDPVQPVNCCAAIYNQIQPTVAATVHGIWQAPFWPAAFGLLSAGLVIIHIKSFLIRNRVEQKMKNGLIFVLGILWVLAAFISLIFFFTPYIYQVLGHHCPFCLFLPEHYGIGFLLFGLLFIVSVESPLPFLLYRLQSAHPNLSNPIHLRCRWSRFLIIGSIFGFCFTAVFPALLWRLRFGVWI